MAGAAALVVADGPLAEASVEALAAAWAAAAALLVVGKSLPVKSSCYITFYNTHYLINGCIIYIAYIGVF